MHEKTRREDGAEKKNGRTRKKEIKRNVEMEEEEKMKGKGIKRRVNR